MKAVEILENAYAEEQERIEKQHKREFESLKDILVSMGLPDDEIYHEGHGKARIAGIIIYRSNGGMYAYGERGPIEEVESLADMYRLLRYSNHIKLQRAKREADAQKDNVDEQPPRRGFLRRLIDSINERN